MDGNIYKLKKCKYNFRSKNKIFAAFDVCVNVYITKVQLTKLLWQSIHKKLKKYIVTCL